MSDLAPPYDVVYGVAAGSPPPPARLVVDYDLTRLATVAAAREAGPRDAGRRRCCELDELEGPFGRILLNVLPFTPAAQLEVDFAAAGRLLATDGEVRVLIHLPKAARMVRRLLESAFDEVEKERGRRPTFRCRDPRPAARPRALGEVRFRDPISGRELELATRPGLFSPGGVDAGTRLLLAAVGDLGGLRVLDLGCGWGVIGAVAAARGAAAVTLIDCDARAVALARRNLGHNGLSGAVLLGDGAGELPPSRFERVLSNPPTHAGSAVLRRLFAETARLLTPGGRAIWVLRQHLAYEKWLRPLGRLRTLSAEEGYKILELVPAPGDAGGERRREGR